MKRFGGKITSGQRLNTIDIDFEWDSRDCSSIDLCRYRKERESALGKKWLLISTLHGEVSMSKLQRSWLRPH